VVLILIVKKYSHKYKPYRSIPFNIASLDCKNRHEGQVRALEQMTARNILRAQRIGLSYLRNAIFYGLVGVLFAGFGLMQLRFLGLQAVFFLMIGVFLLHAAAANYFESRKYK